MTPKITIITITYQAADVLPQTLNSILRQTYRNIEHIVIDGASTDGTLEALLEYKETSDGQDNGHTVSIQSEPDGGIYDAMNKGLEKTTGDFVVFMNAGDWLPDEYTVERVALHADDDVAVIYGDTNIVDAQGNIVRGRRLSPPEKLTWRSFRQGMLVCHQAFYARADIAKGRKYNLKYRHSADVDWCIRVMREAERRGMRLVGVHNVVANFLRGGDSKQNHWASLRERFMVMGHQYGWCTTVVMHLWFVVRAVMK